MRSVAAVLIVLIAAVMLSGCVAEKGELVARAAENKVYDCQCHEEPWKYKPHRETDCRQCHGSEILSFHNFTGDVASVNCYECHEKSLLSNHMPKGCELCHGEPAKIHEKFLEKYLEVER